MQTLEINATPPWFIVRMFTDYTAGNVRTVCASPDGPHDATGRFDSVLANSPFNVNAVDAANCERRSPRCEVRPVRQSKFDFRHSRRLWIQRFHSALNEKGRAGFVMVNRRRNEQSCSMKLTDKVRKYAAEQGIAEEEALKKGMEVKAKEFAETVAEGYAKARA